MLDVRMKDENTSWQEWYEKNPRPRKSKPGTQGLTYGLGINDMPYVCVYVDKSVKPWVTVYRCRFYGAWESMIRRAHQVKWSEQNPTYETVTVSENFKFASKFKSWMETQITKEGDETLHLDKDILVPGNKVYSEQSCCFVPQFINKCINICERSGGRLPTGVTSYMLKDGSLRYSYGLSTSTGKVNKSGFLTPESAHTAWQVARANLIESAITRYQKMICYRQDVVDALMVRVNQLRDQAEKGIETKILM